MARGESGARYTESEGKKVWRRAVAGFTLGGEQTTLSAAGLSLGRFFSFFFCNHAFIVFRYKKPHAALAMERTEPINQKQITKES